MTTETAQMLLAGITLVGFIVWLIGLQFLLATARVGKSETLQAAEADEPWPEGWLTGSAEVEGQPAVLVKRAAALLVKGGAGFLGPLQIVECTNDRLAFERLGPVSANQAMPNWFRRGELRFTSLGRDRTHIAWGVERAAPRWLLRVGALYQLLGLIALVAGSWTIYTLVTSSPDPAIRWQTVQMVQAVHFLWPPFLFAALYRRGVRSVRATFEALTNNLPYCAE